MGGYGSGIRWGMTSKTTVESCRKITVYQLNRHGFFTGFRSGQITWRDRKGRATDMLQLKVSARHDRGHVHTEYQRIDPLSGENCGESDEIISLATTRCNFGGLRYWFICPLKKYGLACKRRVGALYLPPGADNFGCRHCYDLVYQSQKESHMYDTLYAEFYGRMPSSAKECKEGLLKLM
ncbi:MAG: hypothetical protein KAR47_18830 [Planctomycetes bacterium]|nr:hypothetical protein [Planctomycetota bacterium]